LLWCFRTSKLDSLPVPRAVLWRRGRTGLGLRDDEFAVRRSCCVWLSLSVDDRQTAGERSQELRRRSEQTAGVGGGGILGRTRMDAVPWTTYRRVYSTDVFHRSPRFIVKQSVFVRWWISIGAGIP